MTTKQSKAALIRLVENGIRDVGDNGTDMTEVNPYTPTSTVALRPRPVRWFKRILILNCVLFAIPLLLGLIAYLSVRLQIAMEPATLNGDPVTYEHEFGGFTGPDAWALSLYLLVPNGLLAIGMAVSKMLQGFARPASSD